MTARQPRQAGGDVADALNFGRRGSLHHHDRQAEHRRGFLNNNGVVGTLKRDEDDTVHNTDAYAQAEWKFLPRWSDTAGLRHSRVYFNSKDYFIRTGNGNDSGAASFNKTTPAAGIVFNVAPPLNVYANIGRGFETPSFAELAYRAGTVTGLNFALTPSTSLHRELGIKVKTGSLRSNLSVFRIDTNDEIVVNNSAGGRTDYKNASQSRRKGVELSTEVDLGGCFEGYIGYTWLDAHFTLPFVTGTGATATTVATGSRIAGVPGYSLFSEIVWRHAASGFHAGVEVRMAGKIYVNDPNTAASDACTVGSLRAMDPVVKKAPLGHPAIDQVLGGGLARDGLHEVAPQSPSDLAAATGFALGLIEGLTKVFFPEASSTVIFVIMAIVLLVRPAGLFGQAR